MAYIYHFVYISHVNMLGGVTLASGSCFVHPTVTAKQTRKIIHISLANILNDTRKIKQISNLYT
jgi:hypothetical protein